MPRRQNVAAAAGARFRGSWPQRVIKCEGADGYGLELRHMIESILAGKPPTVETAQDGLNAVEICEAAERSVKRGKVVLL